MELSVYYNHENINEKIGRNIFVKKREQLFVRDYDVIADPYSFINK